MSLIDYTKQIFQTAGETIFAANDETQWDFYKKSVERSSFPDTTAMPDSALILAGPPLYDELVNAVDQITDDLVNFELLVPLGFVVGFSKDESQNAMRLYEIGSMRTRWAVGDNECRSRITRGFFNGKSLIYALYQRTIKGSLANAEEKYIEPILNALGISSVGGGYKFGLWSELTKSPFGLCICYRTLGNDFVGSEYLEQTYIEGYDKAQQRGQYVEFENISMISERTRTVKIQVTGASIADRLIDIGTNVLKEVIHDTIDKVL